jgi:hypothetical protein
VRDTVYKSNGVQRLSCERVPTKSHLECESGRSQGVRVPWFARPSKVGRTIGRPTAQSQSSKVPSSLNVGNSIPIYPAGFAPQRWWPTNGCLHLAWIFTSSRRWRVCALSCIGLPAWEYVLLYMQCMSCCWSLFLLERVVVLCCKPPQVNTCVANPYFTFK